MHSSTDSATVSDSRLHPHCRLNRDQTILPKFPVAAATTLVTAASSHELTTRKLCDRATLSSSVSAVPSSNGQELLGPAATSDVSHVSETSSSAVSLPHTMLPSYRCGCQSGHRSPKLSSAKEFLIFYALFEAMRCTQIRQQAFANATCCSASVCPVCESPLSCSLQNKSPAQSESMCIRNGTSDICRGDVNTHLLFFVKYRPDLLSSAT